MTPSPSTGSRAPTENVSSVTATTVAVSPASLRHSDASASSSSATSSATLAKTSRGGASLATNVATRRSAACASPSWSARARDSVFATAVAIRSVKWPRRASVSGPRAALLVPTVMLPHSSPSTTIGLASAERIPSARTASGMPSAVGSSVSKRAALAVARTRAMR